MKPNDAVSWLFRDNVHYDIQLHEYARLVQGGQKIVLSNQYADKSRFLSQIRL